jgi:hypothetical protein
MRGTKPQRAAAASSFSYLDRRVTMGNIVARVLWLQGRFAAAETMASDTLEIARREGESMPSPTPSRLQLALSRSGTVSSIWRRSVS